MEAVQVVAELLSQSAFANLVASIEERIAPLIGEYLNSRAAGEVEYATKAAKDAIWGMIDLRPQEILVLDSPVLQRLRYVRQLGVTFLTYPTAGYSRFEHTLGAMHQAERMLHAIAARSEAKELLIKDVETVRLAAMLHDIGHLPFSHVSERYYSERECTNPALISEINQIREEIRRTLPARVDRLSECLSLAQVLTPSFRKLLGPAGANYSDKTQAEAALSIVGRPPSPERAYLAQIITNVIDADKLDYMFRDAFHTRVPLAVDLERLLFKLRCLTIARDRWPAQLQQMFTSSKNARVLGTDLGGERHAYDLATSRTMLFERVYHHHKTLAAERVVLRMLSNINPHPAELLAEDDRFFSRYASEKHPLGNRSYLSCLDLRQLPRRAFALSYGFLMSTALADERGRPKVSEEVREAWELLESTVNNAERRSVLEREVHELTVRLMSILGENEEPLEIWIDTAPEPYEITEVDLLIERPDGTITQSESFPASAAAFAKNPLALSHIYVSGTGKTGRQLAFISIELLLAMKYKLSLGRAAADHAKVDWEAVERHKRKLESRDAKFFDGCRMNRPRSHFVQTPHAQKRIEQLQDRFSHCGVSSNVVINTQRIQKFLDQFPEAMVEPMLRVIENVVYLDRTELGKKFSQYIRAGAPGNGMCVPLSEESDKSSGHLGYFLADDDEVVNKPTTLAKAIEGEGQITFFDDCLLSGKQGRTVLQRWFGLASDLDEAVASRLSESHAKSIRDKKVRFRFLFATQDGINSLKELTKKLGLGEDVDAAQIVGDSKPLDAILSNSEAKDIRGFLGEVGCELLKSTKGATNPDKWTAERCLAHALGYGGLEQLLVMAYNTLTGTITSLWKSGIVGGVQWMPLFPRRGEDAA